MRQHNWTVAHTEGAISEYLRFAELLTLSPDRELIASTDVDAVWHEHVLDTENYALDCQHMWGRYVHHRRVRTAAERADIPTSYALTKQRYAAHFGAVAPPAYWGSDTQAASLCGGGSGAHPYWQIIVGSTATTTTTLTLSAWDSDANLTTTVATTTAVPAFNASVLAYMGISLGGAVLAAMSLACTHRLAMRLPPPDHQETVARKTARVLTLTGTIRSDEPRRSAVRNVRRTELPDMDAPVEVWPGIRGEWPAPPELSESVSSPMMDPSCTCDSRSGQSGPCPVHGPDDLPGHLEEHCNRVFSAWPAT